MPFPSILCRDCLSISTERARCMKCGSPRVVDAPKWSDLAIAHVDCDAFFASVEKRDDPSLADKPVIVGGGRRGVVATCCYVARTYGVRSAMPMFKALKLCPDAVVVRPDMAKYARTGREIRAMMLALTPLVQPLSIDEAFLDLSGTERLHGGPPAETLARFAAQVEDRVGITVSIGLSYNKFLAKVASDLDKPRGFSVIGREAAPAFLRQHSIGLIWGIGQATLARLERAGLRGIADLQALDEAELMRRVGSDGPRLWRLARGIDDRPVQPERETKSVSAETTFDADLADTAALEPILWRLSEKVSARVKAAGFAGGSITLKLKTADFQIRSRSRSGLPPTQLAKRIFAVGRELLRAEPAGVKYRLIGIAVSALCDPAEADRGDLVDTEARRDVATERAIDSLRERFGAATIVRGIGLGERR